MTRRFIALVVTGVLVGLGPGAARAAEGEPVDELTVKGQTLLGEVVGIDAGAVEFRTIYGEGAIRVPWDDVEELRTRRAYRALTRDGGAVVGRVVAVHDGALLLGDSGDVTESVRVDEIESIVRSDRYQDSWLTRTRAALARWNTSVEVGFHFEEGAVDKTKVNTGIQLERRWDGSVLRVDFLSAFETQKRREGPTQTTKDEFRGFLGFDYDLSPRVFAFVLPAFERDEPRKILFRTFPSAGIGYRLFQRENLEVVLRGGAGVVYSNYDTSNDRTYGAPHLGAEARWEVGWGSVFSLKAIYLPSFENPGDDWLFRGEADLEMPIVDPLALKLRLTNVNDGNPTPDTGNNKFTTTLGFLLRF